MGELQYEIKNGVFKAHINPDNSLSDITEVCDIVEKHSEVVLIGIDLYKCSYIQSKFLAGLVAVKKLAMLRKINIELLNVSDQIAQVLQSTNLQKLFTIKDDYSSFPLDALFERFFDTEKAGAVSEYLAANYDEKIQHKLIELINGGNPLLVEYAILTMGRAQDYNNIEIYRKALNASEASVKSAAILVLGWVGDTHSKEQLYSYLTSKEIGVPEAAAASIALLSDETDSEKLAKYLNDEDMRIRLVAIYALSLINDEKAFEYLSNALKTEEDEYVRVQLAKKISLFKDKKVGQILLGLLDDNSIQVREAAASGLSRRGSGEFTETLVDKIGDKDNWVGFFAAKSLAGIDDEKIIKKIENFYDKVEQNVKLAIIEVLGKCKGVDPSFLLSKLDDANEDIRKEALNSLNLMHGPVALTAAMKLYNTDESWLVRYNAVNIILEQKPVGYESLLRARLKDETNKYILEHIIGEIGE
ncbi:MAG: HEAT repeat domain-containing protein [Candidatus Mucispirillum faecigallinarum]|nr:HEAT repeat domain-containing protein [Candidatus Mucispirillum faecigallinarum]